MEIILNWINNMPYSYNLQNKYLLSLLIIVVTVIGAKVLLLLFEKVLEKFASKTKTELDDLIFEKTKRPLFYLILVYGLKLAVLNLGINGIVSKIINTLMAIVFIFILARAADVSIEVWGKTFAKKTKSNLDDVLLPLFHKVVKVVFLIIALMWILELWGLDITPYLAGAGIAGIVLGFALQDSLKNVFGGITLLLDKTYQIGDKVKLESGEVGTILDIGLRSTKMRTYDNELIYIPNGYLANSRVLNYARPNPQIRACVNFTVEYGTKVEKVREIVLDLVRKMERVLAEPKPSIQFVEMGDFALQFKAYFWVDSWEIAYDKKLEATEKIYNALNKAKIGIPFPTQTIYLKK